MVFLQQVDQAANQGVLGDAAVFGDRPAGNGDVLPYQVAAALGDLFLQTVEEGRLFIGQEEGNLFELLVSRRPGCHLDSACAGRRLGSGGHAGSVVELLEFVN